MLQSAAAFAGLVGSLGWRGAQARTAQPALAFLAVGDWGRDGAFNQREVAAAMGQAAAEIGSRFVLSVGDNFYPDGMQSVTDPQWRTSFEDVYTAPSLQTPWHVALGNHDYHGRPEAEIEYSAHSKRWSMPARYYVRHEQTPDGAAVDIFVLDTSPMVRRYWEGETEKARVKDQDVPAQLRWLEAALARSTAPWKIAVGHHPVFSGGEHGSTPEMIAAVKPLFERHGVRAYLSGHDHDLQHIEIGAVHYICTGAGSETRPTAVIPGSKFASDRSGFTAARLSGEALDFQFRDSTGAVLYEGRVDRVARAVAA
jgi:acid phosphatase